MQGYIQWWELQMQDNLLLIKHTKDETKNVTASGIIIPGAPSSVTDRPSTGIIMSQGPGAKKFNNGMQVFFAPQASFDLEMIMTKDDEKYLMVPEDRVDALRVKDVRKA